ncbi:hypothetical protein MMC29_007853 [Sticta canariensis]|nr:hypothetical protein [Sticta canariensis]
MDDGDFTDSITDATDYGDFTDPMDLIGPVDRMDSTDPVDQSNETVQIDTQPLTVETDHSPTNTNSMNPQTTATRPSAAQIRARSVAQPPTVETDHSPTNTNSMNPQTTATRPSAAQIRARSVAQRAELELQRDNDSQAPSGRPVGFRRAVYGLPANMMARAYNARDPLPNRLYPRPRSGYEPSAPMEPSNESPIYVPPVRPRVPRQGTAGAGTPMPPPDASPSYVPQVHPRVPGRGTAGTDTPMPPPDASPSYVRPHARVPGRGAAGTDTPMPPPDASPSYVRPHARVPGRGAAGTDAPMQAPAPSQSTPYVPTQTNVVAPEAAPILYPIPGPESEAGGLPAAGASRNMSHIEYLVLEEQARRDAYGSHLTRDDFHRAIFGASGSGRTRVPGSQHRIDHADARRAQDEAPNLHRRADKKRPPPKTDEELTVNLSCKVCFEQTCTVVVLPCRR